MKLYVARHAWAGHCGDAPPPGAEWSDDSERPLTAEGIERYRRMVERLPAAGFRPEAIATSPYTRCVQTAELIAERTGAPITELEALAIGADLDELAAWTNTQAVEHACWVGHNPDVEGLVATLVGDGEASVRCAKGAVACLRFEAGRIEPGEGILEWHATAKLLGV